MDFGPGADYSTTPHEIKLSMLDGHWEYSKIKAESSFGKLKGYDNRVATNLIKLFKNTKVSEKSKLGCLRLISSSQFNLFIEKVRKESDESVINIFYNTLKPAKNINKIDFEKAINRVETILYENLLTNLPANLNKGNGTEILEKYLNTHPSQYKIASLIQKIGIMPRDETAKDVWKTVDSTVKRYEQLAKAEIEEGGIPAYENLQIALFIEEKLKKADLSDRVFEEGEIMQLDISPRAMAPESADEDNLTNLLDALTLKDRDKSTTLPRTIILNDGHVTILSHRDSSAMRHETKSKRITCAARVPLYDLSAEPENVTNVEMKLSEILHDLHHKRSALKHEWKIMKELKGEEGFVHGHYMTDACSRANEARMIISGCDGTLLDLYDQGLNQDIEQLVSVAEQLIDRVNFMHKKNIVHMNLKPDNILFKKNDANENQVLIANFDRALHIKLGAFLPNEYGDIRYSPPELANNFDMVGNPEQLKRLDAWALGLSLFRLSYGEVFPIGPMQSDLMMRGDTGLGLGGGNVYEMSPGEYAFNHKEAIEDTLEKLLEIPENERKPYEKYKIIVLQLLRYEPKNRISLEVALRELGKLKHDIHKMDPSQNT